MAVNETIVTGRKFRKCIDAVNKQWQRISFWHKASDCEFDDGKTAENKVGAIDGITSDLSGESETIAASIKCVKQVNESLENIFSVPDYSYGVDLLHYTSEANTYIFPENGYVYLNSGWNNDVTAFLSIKLLYDENNGIVYCIQARKGYSNTALIPVKKGWKAYINGIANGNEPYAKFYKLLK